MQYARKIIIILSLASIILFSWLALLDSQATQQIDAGLKRGLITFASARTLNAAISVAQGTQVAIEPMGIGVTLTPGQVLDPINDLVEQFSNLMLVACVALGAQKIFINVGGYWPVSLLLTIAIFGWSYFYFRLKQPPIYLSKLIVVLLMIRFAIPIVTIGTDLLFQKFLTLEYQRNQQSISEAPKLISDITPKSQTRLSNGEKWWDQPIVTLKGAMKSTGEALDVKKQVDDLHERAEQWTLHVVNLIVIFLLQTLIIPVLLMFILYKMMKNILGITK